MLTLGENAQLRAQTQALEESGQSMREQVEQLRTEQ